MTGTISAANSLVGSTPELFSAPCRRLGRRWPRELPGHHRPAEWQLRDRPLNRTGGPGHGHGGTGQQELWERFPTQIASSTPRRQGQLGRRSSQQQLFLLGTRWWPEQFHLVRRIHWTTLDGQNTADTREHVLPPESAWDRAFSRLHPAIRSSSALTVAITDPNDLTYALGQGQTITVAPSFLTRDLDAGINVTIHSNDDITIDSPITVTSTGTPGSLT